MRSKVKEKSINGYTVLDKYKLALEGVVRWEKQLRKH
jgi:hypothetical protein